MWKRERAERRWETGERGGGGEGGQRERGKREMEREGEREWEMKTVHCQCLSYATPGKSTGPLHAHLNAAFTEVAAAAPGALTPPTPPRAFHPSPDHISVSPP